MLIALIFLANLLVVGIAFFLRWRKWRTAHIWMILVFISLVEWLLLILIRIENFSPLALTDWMTVGDTPVSLLFQINAKNWPLAFSFITTIPALLLTGIARLDVRQDLKFWSAGILFLSIAFLASLAADLWSVVILWTALDLLEVFLQLVVFNETNHTYFQRSLIVRFFGSLMLIFVTASHSTSSINPMLSGLSDSGSILIFLAALLHSGILPLRQLKTTNHLTHNEWIISDLVKLVILITSFAIFIYFPKPTISFFAATILQIVTYLLIIRIGLSEIADIEKKSEFLWPLFIAGFIVFLYLNSANFEFWLPALFLPSIFLLVYSHRNQSTIFFPLIMTLLVSGLPYKLNSFGSRAFLFEDFRLVILWVLPLLVIFLARFLKKSLQNHKEFSGIESIYQIVYLFGLLVLTLSSGVISFKFNAPFQMESNQWWVGVIVVSLLVVFLILHRSRKFHNPFGSKLDMTGLTQKVLSLDWVSRFTDLVEKRLRNLAASFSNLFEGAGGFLWALVILILILTIIR